MIHRFSLVLVAALAVVACGKKEEPKATAPAAAANAEEKVLNIYNWPDYIAKDLIANFEKDTGIKVNYQTFENNEGLQAKLVAGNTGYDIVVPGSVFVKAQIDAGLLKKLDKSQIPNYKNLDANLMGKLVGVDPGNEHVIPWAWSFTTVAINKAKVAKALGSTPMPENAWDLVFNPLTPASSNRVALLTWTLPPKSSRLRCITWARKPIRKTLPTTKPQVKCWPRCARTFAFSPAP